MKVFDVLTLRFSLFRRHLSEALRSLRGKPPLHVNELATTAELREQLAVARQQVGFLAQRLSQKDHESRKSRVPFQGAPAFEIPPPILGAAARDTVTIIDVGAQNLDSQDHMYSDLVKNVRSKIICFEPLEEERRARHEPEKGICVLPNAVGSGGAAMLHETRFNPASSLLEPNFRELSQFAALPEMLEVVTRTPLKTVRLDDIIDTAGCRILKIDVQGGELDVLRGALTTLSSTIVVFVEVEFFPIYSGQPLFPEIHSFLESHGFELLDLVDLGYGSYRAADCSDVRSRLLWADGFYVRRLENSHPLPATALVQLACAAHYCAGKYDYATHVLTLCDQWHATDYAPLYRDAIHAWLARLAP